MEKFKLQSRRYLGCKTKLVDYIHEIVRENCSGVESVVDIFAGTGVVGYSFTRDCSVSVNDTLESNVCAYHTFFSNQRYSHKKIGELINAYNICEPQEDNYYSINFGGTYLSEKNMKKSWFH